jgi:hypothetical protein
MGFKNTVEIITKDIEELEKIVRNFQNYSRIPRIELDLALGKMQNIYELILLIRENEDQMTDHPSSGNSPGHEDLIKPPASSPSESHRSSEKHQEEDSLEFINEEEQPKEEIKKQETEIKPESSADQPGKEETKEKNLDKEQKEKIIAEKFLKQGEFINEKIGGGNKGRDLSSRIQSTPIKSIGGSMGINDKFYFIRELFNGNAEYFRQAMNVLDQAENFNEAYTYIQKTFDWDMDSETVQQLLNLIRRKFISTGND